MTMSLASEGWCQLNLACADWRAAERMATAHLRPLLVDAGHAGAVEAWWFVRKGDTWRVRIRPAHEQVIDQMASTLLREEAIGSWTQVRYEPETQAFGGPAGMEIAHELFSVDSRRLLEHLAQAGPHLRRELPVVLAARFLRAAGLDTYEQGDCWHQLATHRTPVTPPAAPEPRALLAVHTLITASADAPQSPLHADPAWVDAFEHAGRNLAALAAAGTLTRGLRGVLVHHLLFLFNRHGVGATDLYALATAASTAIFGLPDTSPTTGTPVSKPTSQANNSASNDHHDPDDAAADREQRAAQLRDALTDYIAGWGTFRTPQIEAAFRTVPRHRFLPGIDLDTAYGRNPIVTRRAADGTSLSSASSPTLVATMLEQLAPQPGHAVLEIGTATGINAALLAELVGQAGDVVSIELDDDLAASAADHLRDTGYRVHVVCGDGALGHAQCAPYDRLIVTAEATDLAPAWWDQLRVGGRAVVPLRLHGSGLTRALAFDHDAPGRMTSTSAVVCGFVPMRGSAESTAGHVRLADDVILKIDIAESSDHAALAAALHHPSQPRWTGIRVRHDEPAEHLDLWLATTTDRQFGRLSVSTAARTSGIADPALRWGGAALHDEAALVYLTAREPTDDALELGITAHGPDSDKLAAHLADLLDTWAQHRPAQPTITAHHAADPAPVTSSGTHLRRPHTLFTINW
ncbi:methyltransferase, FxLD system [Frankia sp. AgB32]|uniref:methyltransferase, FxLD system n=1 Tax=Frankia sp. AgB32 TaxID=631119 RepID=UPI00200CE26F|nr:methyltransferase, FxLD system [Frankia sp. AgB32]MCK9895026.1 methyltransferase, FxLD system [Frankia sp. AgB32]